MNLQEFHKYRRLAEEGHVEPLTHTCGALLITRATYDGDPILECIPCGSKTQPGMKIYNMIVAVNEEFYT